MDTGTVLFLALGILLIVQVPVGIAIGLATFIAILHMGTLTLGFVSQALVTGLDSFPIMAIPLFIFAGDLMGAGGVSKRILNVASIFFGGVTGGLAIVTVVVCMFFATVSGSGPATVAAVGSMVVPTMLEKGYSKSFTLSLIATAGAIGVIIPPSIPMVIFGVTTGASITHMFMAGILPGILIGLMLIVYCYFYGRKHGLKDRVEAFSAKRAGLAIWDAKWALINPIIILGGIYGGFFTPTEAAAVAAVYAFVCGTFIYRELKLGNLLATMRNSCSTIGTVLVILGSATAFTRLLTLEQIPAQISYFLTGVTTNAIIMILLINIFLLIVGMFMDTTPAIMVLAPMLLPVAISIGMHPVHFGIMMIVNKAVGFLTPPLGINLFVATRVGNTSLETVLKGIAPFIAIMVAALLIVSFWPALTLTLNP